MSEAEFRVKRRQRFLTEKYFSLNAIDLAHSVRNNLQAIEEQRAIGGREASSQGSTFKNTLKLLRLHYTAGDPISSLLPLFSEVVRWFEQWHIAYRQHIKCLAESSAEELRTDGSPAYFEDLFHFQLVLDVVSLGILLGEGDAVRQAASWLTRYRGTDMMFEALVERVVPDPRDVEEFFHERPYGLLLDAIYTANTPDETVAFMKAYLDNWYKAFEGVPWHNGHLQVTDEYSNYEGYWAFEAAAVCVLHGIDDSSFRDHLVYPKDLADWARANQVADKVRLGASSATAAAGLRCEAGQSCPRTGFWFTPARESSRQRFEQGQVMPEAGTDYGTTIWQWDDCQD
ncbi:MAG TPA: PoNe immunity protein domain-containing protein [Ideonella sp.]|uniref:PoNe immunity protein domain-containing protein n=1 Tax=Ideonella sp. TaxID=1929293 RepID=UPI002BA145F6|nr:PoNe immunity protein domain-containing protein [Ideonella sp.]HSI51707.1 PoNe immunity protein domain-containing protein [Ideonella sp.]